MHTKFWWRTPKERNHLENLEVDGSKFIKMDLKSVGRTWAGLIWPRIGTSGGLL
jgi:hypothetical protein